MMAAGVLAANCSVFAAWNSRCVDIDGAPRPVARRSFGRARGRKTSRVSARPFFTASMVSLRFLDRLLGQGGGFFVALWMAARAELN